MKKLLSFLKQRWVASLFGVLALSILIWFAGPYIGIAGTVPLGSATVRLLVILFLVVCWGLNNLRKQMQASRANDQIIDDIAESATMAPPDSSGTDESAEEVGLLKQRFEDAMVILKKSRQKDGAASLYDLPWYIIIGPPGAGKTTALLNSGLKFPLEEQLGSGELKGIGGTRNCDWLFTDQAVLLDTAGRYVTQDSHAQVDSAAWTGFLDLLKKNRRRRPVNGVLVAISLADLMQQDHHERDAHVRAIKRRIQELYEHFGMQIPVYVLLTKCDLVAGFTEFFDDLGREERAQVWGLTFPLGDEGQAADVSGDFDREFDHLIERLNTRLLSRVSQERDLKRRGLIYTFPQQMSSLKDALAGFLGGVFQSNRFENSIMLRGVYFTSGTQEGRPIDRLMGAVARSFGLDHQSLPGYGGHGRSYFITRLLNEVVFPESGLAGQNRRLESRRAWLQRGSYAGILIITVLAVLGWVTSYTANKSHVNELMGGLAEYEQTRAASSMSADASTVLARLDSLKAASDIANKHNDDVPLHMRFWLYQGDALGDVGSDAYIREMNNGFIPRLANRLENQLSRSSNNSEFQYEALKTYLMLGNPQRMDSEHLTLWMEQDWQTQYPNEADKQARLKGHLETLLNSVIRPVTVDRRLVARVRKNLARVPLAQLVYGRLKRESSIYDDAAFRVIDVAGPGAAAVFELRSGGDIEDAAIPELFTYHGFYKSYQAESLRLVEQISNESWVLGDDATEIDAGELQGLEKDIRELYIKDYIANWDDLLGDIKLVSSNSIGHATQVLQVLIDYESPMRLLLQAVEENTALNRLPDGAQGVAKIVGQQAKRKSRFARLLGQAPEIDLQAKVELPGNRVDQYFQRLNRLSQSRDNRSPPIEDLNTLLSDVYGGLLSAEGVGQGFGGGDNVDLRRALQRLQVAAARIPEPVKGWVKQLTYDTQLVLVSSARNKVNANWTASILPACEKALSNRYPFQKDKGLEVTINDFGLFFKPGGEFDQFFEEELSSLVDTSKTIWQWRSGGTEESDLLSGALGQMQRAARIKNAFFQNGASSPVVNFTLKPVYLDAQVTRFVLDLAGEKFVYRHGPAIERQANWPGSGGNGRVRIIFEEGSGKQASISEDGPWAWFRVLDQAQKQIISTNHFIATFAVDGHKAKYEVRANSVINNPFLMQDLRGFKCPQRF